MTHPADGQEGAPLPSNAEFEPANGNNAPSVETAAEAPAPTPIPNDDPVAPLAAPFVAAPEPVHVPDLIPTPTPAASIVAASTEAFERSKDAVEKGKEAFEKGAEESFRMANQGVSDLGQVYSGATEALETSSHAVRSSFEEIATGMSLLSGKLMEFARANTQSQLDFARDLAATRSLPELLALQSAFVRRQYDLFLVQTQELQGLATQMTEKASAPFKEQAARTGAIFRS